MSFLTQERQQVRPETAVPSLDASESIIEAPSDSDSTISNSTVADMSDVGNTSVLSTYSTTNLHHPTHATASLPKPPRQLIEDRVCIDWWHGQCFRHACKFLHFIPPQTHGHNFVGYSEHRFRLLCPDCY
jgi:hypothetical protein